MKTLLLAALALSLGRTASAADAPAPASFSDIQAQYFTMLNLRADEEILAAIPAFSAKLTVLAEIAKAKMAIGKLSAPAVREQAGLVLIYDALMTTNNSNAVIQGKLKLSDLRKAHAFGPASGDDKAEMLARAEHNIKDLQFAAELRPDDHRIDSWLVAARIQKERLLTGKLSKKVLTASLDAIPARPTFNLWTSFLLFREQPSDTKLFKRLAGEAKGFVDRMKTADNPCAKRPEDCGNGPKAPYNLQASVTELGDVFLRRAETYLQAGDVPHAMEMAGYAKGTYSVLAGPDHAAETKAWPDAMVLAERLDRVYAIQRREVATPLLARTENYRRPYECASCHGR